MVGNVMDLNLKLANLVRLKNLIVIRYALKIQITNVEALKLTAYTILKTTSLKPRFAQKHL